jgi:hypothetical protein
MADGLKNFAWALVASAPDPALSGLSLGVTAGAGALFQEPCNCVVWPAGENPTVSNATIIRIASIAGDVFGFTRQAEGSANRAILAGDQIAAAVTAKSFQDVYDAIAVVDSKAASGSANESANLSSLTSRDVSQSALISAAQSTADGGAPDSAARSMATSAAGAEASDNTSQSLLISAAQSTANGGAPDSVARSMATSAALVESTDNSAATSKDTSQSGLISTATANASVADSKAVSSSTVDSTNLSATNSKDVSQSGLISTATANASVADSKAVSSSTVDSTNLSATNSKDTSQSGLISTADSKAISGSNALTEAPANQAYSGITVSMTYGESLAAGDLVYFKSDGTVWKADANAAGLYPVMGMAVETAASGSHVVLLQGIYRDDTRYAFTVGGAVYLSTTAGAETQTQPSATDDVIQVVGVATHADRIYFKPDLSYITHT